MIFFNDMESFLKRLDYVDMSSNKDSRQQKLKYFHGLDQLRNRMHGKVKATIDDFVVHVYPSRCFSKFDSFLSITLSDFFYNQAVYY